MEFSIRITGSSTAACCPDGSWAPPEHVRYALPPNSSDAHVALVNVYGSLLGTVQPNGEINFEFEKIEENDVPSSVTARYGKDFVHWCFAENTQVK